MYSVEAKAEKEPDMAKAKKDDMSMAKAEKEPAMSMEAKSLKEPEMSMAKASKVMSVWVLSSPFDIPVVKILKMTYSITNKQGWCEGRKGCTRHVSCQGW